MSPELLFTMVFFFARVLIAVLQVDAIVTSVKPTGIFTLAGPLVVFVARKVR